jgi:Helix-turn-helix domain
MVIDPQGLSTGDIYRPYGMPEVHRAIRACPQLSSTAKILWEALVDRQGGRGECFAANGTLATDIGCSTRVVIRHLNELEAEALIRRTMRLSPQGRRTSNTIEFLWRPLEELRGDENDTAERRRGDEIVRDGGDENDTPVGDEIVRVYVNEAPKNEAPLTKELRGDENDTAQRLWNGTGWDSPEDFEAWWAELVAKHPNRSRNGLAKNKAVELIVAGEFTRARFETGYESLAEAGLERWTEQGGRFAPNLWTILDDRLWTFQAPAKTASIYTPETGE